MSKKMSTLKRPISQTAPALHDSAPNTRKRPFPGQREATTTTTNPPAQTTNLTLAIPSPSPTLVPALLQHYPSTETQPLLQGAPTTKSARLHKLLREHPVHTTTAVQGIYKDDIFLTNKLRMQMPEVK
ncbi:hypothetical protein EK21DRAFT_86125 [Setomelanomma holmii]|uniref:Uncharacterized protein n=1 Tax=Setomelanomma holmii TaxID=210430 RepID=A0A9P4LSD5_9PLEO|nr:hypothetical protein EK21DRAFT_86125 [Setomelanomma holmii]